MAAAWSEHEAKFVFAPRCAARTDGRSFPGQTAVQADWNSRSSAFEGELNA